MTALKNKVATKVFVDGDYLCVKYHNTIVIRFNAGSIVLDSGGWQTVTTKRQINQVSQEYGLGLSVYQKDFSWYVDYNCETIEFVDGLVLKR